MRKVTHSWTRPGNPDALAISSPLQSRVLPQRQTVLQILLPLAVPCSTDTMRRRAPFLSDSKLLSQAYEGGVVYVFVNVKVLKNIKVRTPSRRHCKCTAYHIYIRRESAYQCQQIHIFREARAHKASLLCSRATHPHTQLLLV